MATRLAIIVLFLSITFSAPLFAEDKSNATNKDLESICQLTINLDKLDAYYKVDKFPRRSPLRILKNKEMKGELSLSKFGRKVRYVSISEEALKSYTKPYLEFTKIDIKGDNAEVEFKYPPEGIRGKISFRKADGYWKVRFSSVINYPKVITVQKQKPEKLVPTKEIEKAKDKEEAVDEMEEQKESSPGESIESEEEDVEGVIDLEKETDED